MKLENPIGWCDVTTNCVTGCEKVSPGCKNCYAEVGRAAHFLRHRKDKPLETWGPNGVRVPVNFEPVFRRLNKLCVCDKCKTRDSLDNFGCGCALGCGGKNRRIRLFADSNSDWLDPKWPVETRTKFLDSIRLAPNVDVQLLTKRIELFHQLMAFSVGDAKELKWGAQLVSWMERWLGGQPPKNVWLGVSIEDQKRADERIPLLLKTPAAVRFLSVEPLLEKVDLKDSLGKKELMSYSAFNSTAHVAGGIDWVIIGGESGKNRRDCGPEAIKDVWRQCQAAGVPCYVKQDSALLPGQRGRLSDEAWNTKEFPKV